MVKVIPAIIPESFDDVATKLSQVRGLVSRVQVDSIDGKYAPPVTWPYNSAQKPKLPHEEGMTFEIDMMVEKPEQMVDDWIEAGAKALIIHTKSTDQLGPLIDHITSKGVEVGLAIIPSTPIDVLDAWMEKIDFVQLMGNDKIGYHGVALDETVYAKASGLRQKYPNSTIAVDIGVNFNTAPKLIAAGVTKLVSGSSIFNSDNITEAIKYFKSLT